MDGAFANLVLRQLRELREGQCRLLAELQDMKMCLNIVDEEPAQLHRRMDRLEQRLDRIERQLELVEV